MFYRCYSLTYLDLIKLDTPEVSTLEYMFASSINIVTIEISNLNKFVNTLLGWNTSNVESMSNMFNDCEKFRCIKMRYI